MKVFDSLGEALRQGYVVYDHDAAGYTVRIATSRGWARALVRPL
jgi:hypothetical protein